MRIGKCEIWHACCVHQSSVRLSGKCDKSMKSFHISCRELFLNVFRDSFVLWTDARILQQNIYKKKLFSKVFQQVFGVLLLQFQVCTLVRGLSMKSFDWTEIHIYHIQTSCRYESQSEASTHKTDWKTLSKCDTQKVFHRHESKIMRWNWKLKQNLMEIDDELTRLCLRRRFFW